MSRGRLIARACCACVTFGLLVAGLPPSVSAQLAPLYTGSQVSDRAAGHRIDEWGTRASGVPICHAAADLDCVERLRVKSGNEWRLARLVSSEVVDSHEPGFEPGTYIVMRWEYESKSKRPILVDIGTHMFPRGMTYRGKDYLLHGFEAHLSPVFDETHPNENEGVIFDCSLGVLEHCLLGPTFPKGDRFELTVRTSWLRDNGVSISGADWSVSHAPYEVGERWVLSARQTFVSVPAPGQFGNPEASSKGWEPVLAFLLTHAGESLQDSAFDPRCSQFGAPWQTRNTWGAGRLHWVKSKQTLDFEVHAPHLNPYGKPLEGEFSAQIPLAWLRCFAGKKLNPAYFTVSVVNEGGEEQVATTSLRVRKGTVFVRATGFHFSSPTIQLSTKKSRK